MLEGKILILWLGLEGQIHLEGVETPPSSGDPFCTRVAGVSNVTVEACCETGTDGKAEVHICHCNN
jgi:hypothetical protein